MLYICMLGVSMLPVSMIILFDFRIVLTMSYFLFFISLYIFIAISKKIVRLVCLDQSVCYYSSICIYAIQCSLGLSPPVISPKFLSVRFPPLKIPRYTAKLSYCHPPQVFRHKSRKTNLNSPISTTQNYLLTAVY